MYQISKIKNNPYVCMKSGSDNTFYGIVDVPYEDGCSRCTLSITWGPNYEIASVGTESGKLPAPGDIDFVRRLVFKYGEDVIFQERSGEGLHLMCMIRERGKRRKSW